MTAAARSTFRAQEIAIACAVAVLAQLGFIALLSLPSPELVIADISSENSQPIAVAITPVLKLGAKTPSKLPPQWQRRKPAAAKTPAPLPSPQAEKTPEAIPKSSPRDAAAAPVVVDAGPTEQPPTPTADAGGVATIASAPGSELGLASGTEADPLKARAADRYRAELAAWFASRFDIRGKVPFDHLKTLHAAARVSVAEDRKVGSFSIEQSSGDPAFDAEVQATLRSIESSGVELPAPPPNYPDMLGSSRKVEFSCTTRSHCE